MSIEPVLAVQGGSGRFAFNLSTKQSIEDAIRLAARRGYRRLTEGGTALDAVETVVQMQEDHPIFNAGRGSYMTCDRTIEMDAAIMDGKTLDAGSVTCVTNVTHPVHLARLIMEKSDHVMLSGEAANKFAADQEMPVATIDDLVTEKAKWKLNEMFPIPEEKAITNRFPRSSFSHQPSRAVSPEREKRKAWTRVRHHSMERKIEHLDKKTVERLVNGAKAAQNDTHDTVGAVAIDSDGNVAMATSTGGSSARIPGRVSDCCIIGGGGYADNRVGAVVATGNAESFLKACTARHVVFQMQQGKPPEEAIGICLEEMRDRFGCLGGAIAVSAKGDVGVRFTTPGMAWAVIKEKKITYGIHKGEVHTS